MLLGRDGPSEISKNRFGEKKIAIGVVSREARNQRCRCASGLLISSCFVIVTRLRVGQASEGGFNYGLASLSGS